MLTVTGSRRLGILIPSSNTSVEAELSRALPATVTLHSSRLTHLSGVDPDAVEVMVQDVERASSLIGSAGMDLIMLFATVPSLFRGPNFDKEIAARITALTGTPTITTSTAMLDALRLMGAKRLALGTPFMPSMNARIVHFLESNGFEVATNQGLCIEDNLVIGRLAPQSAYELAVEIDRPDVDTVLLACTNWQTLPVIEKLEARLGKPVITTTQASLKAIVNTLGFHPAIAGLGRLFETDRTV